MDDLIPGGAPGRPPVPSVPVVAVVTAALGALVALTVWSRSLADPGAGWLAWDLVVGVLGCATLPVTLRRPVTGALAATVLAAVSPVATPPATAGVLFVAQRRRFQVSAAVAAAGIAAHAVQGWWQPVGGLSYGWWLVLMSIAYAALLGWGTLARAHRALVASWRERARRAEAEQGRRVAEARILERTRIAREMHDVLAHRLSLLATYAGALEYRPDAPPEQLSRAAAVVRTGVHEALAELREVIGVLRHATGDPDGARPQPGLADLDRLVAESRAAGTPVRLDDRIADPPALPAATGRTAYRVVQEALTNARKHAPGETVDLTLAGQPGTRLVVEVRNRLRADPAGPPAAPGTGTGLIGLTERVRLAGGQLDHQATAGGEFRLAAWLPWPA